jgi:hypothetical protein
MGEKCPINLAYNRDFHGNCRVILDAANLRHGTDGFTSPPKEGMLRIFSLRPGLNPRTWVPEASMLTTRLPKSLPVAPDSLSAVCRGPKKLKIKINKLLLSYTTRAKREQTVTR